MILFRCDASSRLGVGHLARCRTLAATLRELGQECVLVGPPADYRVAGDGETFREWLPMPFAATPREDAARLVDLASERHADFAVLDDYRIDDAYQDEMRRGNLRWLQFSRNPARPVWADIVLDPSPEPTAADYRDSVMKPGARLLLGPDYAILRAEFDAVDPVPRAGGGTRVLLAFGGGDDRGAIVTILETLLPELPADTEFLVISGRHNPANPRIAAWIDAHGRGRVDLHVDPPGVAALIATCDLAIMAGGGMVFEVNRFAIPMVLVALADNQDTHSRAWARRDAARYLGRIEDVDPGTLLSAAKCAIAAAAASGERRAVPRLVDGRGRIRVAEAIIEAMRT